MASSVRSIRLEDSLWERLKTRATACNTTVNQLVLEAIVLQHESPPDPESLEQAKAEQATFKNLQIASLVKAIADTVGKPIPVLLEELKNIVLTQEPGWTTVACRQEEADWLKEQADKRGLTVAKALWALRNGTTQLQAKREQERLRAQIQASPKPETRLKHRKKRK